MTTANKQGSKTDADALAGEQGDELLAKLEEGFPPTWLAENAGDTITGAFLRLESGMTQYGPAPIVILGTADGERSVWLFYESLKSAFRRAQPEPGERVAIRYDGEQPVKNPTPGKRNTFHAYRVAVDRPAVASKVDWTAALGAEPVATDPSNDHDEIPY